MLIRASGPILDDLYLLTLGASTRYLLKSSEGTNSIVDPGASIHLPLLLKRLETYGVTPHQLSFIFLTHHHSDRIGAAVQLKRLNPKIQLVGTQNLQTTINAEWDSIVAEESILLEIMAGAMPLPDIEPLNRASPLKLDRIVVDGEGLALSENSSVRVLPANGHTASSTAFLLEPHNYLITDEVAGYFRGKSLPGPGADASIEMALSTVKRFMDIPIVGLCLPFAGVLTGEMIKRHLSSLLQTMEDVVAESVRANKDCIAKSEIKSQIYQGLYTSELSDPILLRSLNRSADALWAQIAEKLI